MDEGKPIVGMHCQTSTLPPDLLYNRRVHELAVTESILKIALDYAEKEHAVSVSEIFLKIGKLSSIVDDSVVFYWQFVSKDTICEHAKLHFERVPARFHCNECDQEFEIQEEFTVCPNCSSANLKLVQGDEFQMDSIAIEK
jgi:hydrogenase nickel incorporation protein HypA/HybF